MALKELTFWSRPVSRQDLAYNSVSFYLSFPLIGVFFGILGYLLCWAFWPISPEFCAWAVPLTWLLLSGLKHFDGMSRFFSATFANFPIRERVKMLGQAFSSSTGISFSLFLLLGKMFAIHSMTFLDLSLVCTALLTATVVSRFAGVIYSVGSGSSLVTGKDLSFGSKFLSALLSFPIVVVVCSFYPALGLVSLLFGLLTIIFVRLLSDLRFDGVYPPSVGALIELAELAILWAPVMVYRLELDELRFWF